RCLWVYRRALSPGRPVASWQVISHKGMRFAVPLFLLVAAGAAGVGAVRGKGWAIAAVATMLTGLVVGLVSLSSPPLRRLRGPRAVGFTLLGSAAVLAA